MQRSQWNQFLQQQGATVDSSGTHVTGSGRPTMETGLVPLLDQGVIRLQGPETKKFLQGQVTCDLDRLSETASLLGSNCTPKGNVISVFRLLQLDEKDLLMRLPVAILEPALANLKKYSVFSKTELSDVSDTWVGVGVIGPGASEPVRRLFDRVPEQPGEQVTSDDMIAVSVPGERFEIWAPVDTLIANWPQLADDAHLAPSSAWQEAEIHAGLVQLDADSIDTYLPQMLNLQAVEGVSFEKGCYTGQEVVARLQHRGKLKKLLYHGEVSGGAPQPGTLLYSGEGRSVGKVIATAPGDDSCTIQAVVNKSEADRGDLHLGEPEGPSVTLAELPYPIDPSLFERPVR